MKILNLWATFIFIVFQNRLVYSKETKHYIIADKCIEDTSNYKLATYDTYRIFSYCKLRDKVDPFPERNRSFFISISHYSPHSYVIAINDLGWVEAWKLKAFYEFILISSVHMSILQYIATEFCELDHFDISAARNEFVHTRWNYDEFELNNSQPTLGILAYNENQLPTYLQKQDERFKTNNVSDLDLMYYITSGYGQQCIHNNWFEKLKSLTYNFNAYDRIFCDAVEYHGLQNSFKGYWNHGDMIYLRGRLIRDGLVSSFPPDTSTAVYYASPKLTFVVLHREPITWMFVARPFQKSVWIFLLVTFTFLGAIRYLKQFVNYYHLMQFKRKMIQRKLFALIIVLDETTLNDIGSRFTNMLEIFNGVLRIMLASAYSGMILVGILNPLYPFTPDTFEELNNTKNYFVATAEHSPKDIMQHARERYVLNKIELDMLRDRLLKTPAHYLAHSISSEFTEIKENENKFYAAVMYDDKMNLWMKGRFIIWITAQFLEKIKPSADKKLSEIRYFSVAPGATRLHFLLTTLKRGFTSGTWMRWYHLEQNYYKNVAPILAVQKLNEIGKQQKEDEHERRPLTIHDFFSVFAIIGVGLAFAFLTCMIELFTTCAFSVVI